MLSTFSPYSPQGLIPQLPPGAFMDPYAQSQWSPAAVGHNPLLNSFAAPGLAHGPVQQIVQTLGQLAQQLAVQSAVAQQIGIAVHQLAHQLAAQGLQGYPGSGFGGGQAFAGAGQPFGGGIQPFGQSQPFGQAGYGGFSPQSQAWGANRQQTIQ